MKKVGPELTKALVGGKVSPGPLVVAHLAPLLAWKLYVAAGECAGASGAVNIAHLSVLYICLCVRENQLFTLHSYVLKGIRISSMWGNCTPNPSVVERRSVLSSLTSRAEVAVRLRILISPEGP